MRCGGGVEVGNAFDGDGGLGQQIEELGEFGLHLVDVFCEVVDDLLLAGGLPLGIAVDGGAEGGEVFVALLVGEVGHGGGDARDFLEADVVNLLGREVGGGHLLDGEA